MHYLFSYGTLQDPEIQEQLFGRKMKAEPDVLLGYELSSQKAYGQYPQITKSQNADAKIEGVALELSEEELERADNYEGPEYTRISVRLKSGKPAWAYVAK
ncbi:gamma-glutamylcyclotransferase family protein [Pseudozobellia thermophila]|uniref:Putative gamma-glutamylcyclotransferase n=1 Tax=Pseudozobellia thermophila TaxID=192903 RepID=A0A1M6CRX3_9FLAO|nr:gamma-glutamylcyclotransferase family protein [Pseudozobellia thermophila]SHI63720.1 Gamma-glutamyl cyclotransferase, AIG2-like [Pseudozobellia thermophila]